MIPAEVPATPFLNPNPDPTISGLSELPNTPAPKLSDWVPRPGTFDISLVDVTPDQLPELLAQLTPEEWADYLTRDYADRLISSLYEYVKAAFPQLETGADLEDGKHLKAICDHIQWQVEDRMVATGHLPKPPGWKKARAQKQLIRIPPRCLKTTIASILAPTWVWLRWPWLTILTLSANPRVTHDAAYASRLIIGSDWYQTTFRPAWQIDPDRDSVYDYGNTAGGWRKSRGMASRVTGEGANWQILDDLHDGEEVYSRAKRDFVHRKWRTISSRLNDVRFDIQTGIAQALHHDDWGERRIKEGWGLLRIRMQYEERDANVESPFGWKDWRTVEGETILPDRYTREWCEQTARELTKIVWSAQYQQDPTPTDGGLVNKSDFRYYDDLEKLNIDQIILSVDAAFKKTTTGSRVSVCVMGRGRDSNGKEIRALLDNDTRPMHMVETIHAIKAMLEKWPQINTVLIEDKANGSEIIRQLQAEITGVVPVNPGNNSKEGRLISVQPVFESNSFYLPRVAPWRDETEYEICTFPNAPKDDIVDAVVQALIYMRGSYAAQRSLAGCQL
jgi:predicted phage terminase large subunit-like protein